MGATSGAVALMWRAVAVPTEVAMKDVGALFYRPEKKRGGREVARADPDVEFSNGMPANPGDVSDDDSFEADS